MWGFWEGANWIPVSSLYRRDWSPTPAAKLIATGVQAVVDHWTGQPTPRADAKSGLLWKNRVTAGGKETIVSLKQRGPRQLPTSLFAA